MELLQSTGATTMPHLHNSEKVWQKETLPSLKWYNTDENNHVNIKHEEK